MAWHKYTNDADTHTWENDLVDNVTDEPSKILLGDTTKEAVYKTNNSIEQTKINTKNIAVLTEVADKLEDAVANAGKLDSLVVNGLAMTPDNNKNLYLNIGVKTNDKLKLTMTKTPEENPNQISLTFDSSQLIPTSEKGASNGIATLDENGHVPSSQLPSFVDDVIEYDTFSSFPTTGEGGKIYVDKATNKTYRWSGTQYTEISASLALGTTSGTAYEGSAGLALAESVSGIEETGVFLNEKDEVLTAEQIIVGNGGHLVKTSGKSLITSIPTTNTTNDKDIPTAGAVKELGCKIVEMTATNFIISTSEETGLTTCTLKPALESQLAGYLFIGAFNVFDKQIIVDYSFVVSAGTFTFTIDNSKLASLFGTGVSGYFVFQKFATLLTP